VKKKILLVTGSSGLIGSQIVKNLSKNYDLVYGIDNNERQKFFGSNGSTLNVKKALIKNIKNYNHLNIDITKNKTISDIIEKLKPKDIVHCAAQPSHDYAAKIPLRDYDVNSTSTIKLMEAVRKFTKKSSVIFFSTNKVYGDNPNKLRFIEKKRRFDFKEKKYQQGIKEDFSIDSCTHSLFGVSKLSADLIVQEYGRYFEIKTCCLRGGCLTGPNQSGVELHGFLNYLIKCNIRKKLYTIFGYKGKQVRDNIHSDDVASFVEFFLEKPRIAEVYNLGGGKENSISILEAFDLIEKITSIPMKYRYVKTNRIGDHICYYSNMKKIKSHYPKWSLKFNINKIFEDIVKNINL
tara:strand:+ start:410 stop:1459 length:1050 start_codon:yes stop_codon:yes gene_type:complete